MDPQASSFINKKFKKLLNEFCDDCPEKTEVIENMSETIVRSKSLKVTNMIPTKYLLKACEILETFIWNEENNNKGKALSSEEIKRSLLASSTILNIVTSPGIDESIYSNNIIHKIIKSIKYQLYTYDKGVAKTGRNVQCRESTKVGLVRVVQLFTDLTNMYTFSDDVLEGVSSLGICAFEHSISGLNIESLKLLSMITSRFKHHFPSLICDVEILIAKQGYELNSQNKLTVGSNSICMLTALLLMLAQASASLPAHLIQKSSKIDSAMIAQIEPTLVKNYRDTLWFASRVVSLFLHRCFKTDGSKTRYCQGFDIFINDLLMVVIMPEWPGSILLLTFVAKELANSMQGEKIYVTTKYTCLDWLVRVMLKLRQVSLLAEKNLKKLDDIIIQVWSGPVSKPEGAHIDITDVSRYPYLQNIFLNHILSQHNSEEWYLQIQQFYVTMWYCEIDRKGNVNLGKESKKKKKGHSHENKENVEESTRKEKKTDQHKSVMLQICCNVKSSKPSTFFFNSEDCELIMSYFISKEDFNIHFYIFVGHVVGMMMATSPRVRARAVSCLKGLVDIEPQFAQKYVTESVIQKGLQDTSIMVREAALDLIGHCLTHIPECLKKYYDVVSPLIHDKGISVQKRVLKIFREIILKYPTFSKIPQIYIRILTKIETEGLKTLVQDIFRDSWFSYIPETPERENLISQRINTINKVVDMIWINKRLCLNELLKKILDDNAEKACEQLVERLVGLILELEQKNSEKDFGICLKTLCIVTRAKPELLVKHTSTMETYLTLHSQIEKEIIICITQLLIDAVPLMDHPSQQFLSQLEIDLVKHCLQGVDSVISSCVSCLVVIVTKVTKNFTLLWDTCQKFYDQIQQFKRFEKVEKLSVFRSLCFLGNIFKYFNFKVENVSEESKKEWHSFTNKVFEYCLSFLNQPDIAVQQYSLTVLGNICCQHMSYMQNAKLEMHHMQILQSDINNMKLQVLKNLLSLLKENDSRSSINKKHVEKETKWTLKENDDSSSLCTTLMQKYVKHVLSSATSSDLPLRSVALGVLELFVQQGLVPPLKILPSLITLTADNFPAISSLALQLLEKIDCDNPRLLHSTLQNGIDMMYKFLTELQKNTQLRGCDDADPPKAFLHHLYKIIRHDKILRQKFIHIMLKHVHDKDKVESILFSVDNLAYLPYEVQEEVYYILATIENTVAVPAYSQIQEFKQALKSRRSLGDTVSGSEASDTYDSDTEDRQSLLSRLPHDTSRIKECVRSFQGYMLLLLLKEHLQKVYGISHRQLATYIYDKPKELSALKIVETCEAFFNPLQVLERVKFVDSRGESEFIDLYLQFKSLIIGEYTHDSRKEVRDNTKTNSKKKDERQKIACSEENHHKPTKRKKSAAFVTASDSDEDHTENVSKKKHLDKKNDTKSRKRRRPLACINNLDLDEDSSEHAVNEEKTADGPERRKVRESSRRKCNVLVPIYTLLSSDSD